MNDHTLHFHRKSDYARIRKDKVVVLRSAVFDGHSGLGTKRTETRYHQRLRPALEYVELTELVHAAAALETAFGQPLDIEFAFDEAQLHILQARPVPLFHAALRETAARYPIHCPLRATQE